MGLALNDLCPPSSGAFCKNLHTVAGLDWSNAGLWQLVLLWIAGAFTGWLLPRPKVSNSGNPTASSSSAWLGGWMFANSTLVKRVALTFHGALIMREVWYHFTCPGTFRRLFLAVVQWCMGKGWNFDFPTASQPGAAVGTPCDPETTTSKAVPSIQEDNWYITTKDLAFFKRSISNNQDGTGAGPWEVMMDREIPGVVKYTAWRRTLANGKTEYKSVTHSPDASAEEFMDMYLDDDNRPNWDTMIILNEVLEYGDFAQRQSVCRWIRRFPFSFISDREYIIAKRMYREGDELFAVTKSMEHPRAPMLSDIVRVDVFYSMWRSRTVPCPWGSGKPACETTLLHHEQMKIPENLSRFAVKHGMWGFVRKLSSETPKFIESRRQRCDSNLADPQAYGYGHAPNPPLRDPFAAAAGKPLSHSNTPSTRGANSMHRTETSTSALSSLTTQSSMEMGNNDNMMYRYSTGGVDATGMPRTKSGRVRGLAAFAIASGLAMLLKRSNSSERIPTNRRSSKSGAVAASGRTMRRVRTQPAGVSDPSQWRRSKTMSEMESEDAYRSVAF